jgi:hypothetical protein
MVSLTNSDEGTDKAEHAAMISSAYVPPTPCTEVSGGLSATHIALACGVCLDLPSIWPCASLRDVIVDTAC